MSIFRKRIRVRLKKEEEEEEEPRVLIRKGELQKATPSEVTFLGKLQERITHTVSKDDLELLFHIDGLTFRQVYEYVDAIVNPGYYFEGEDELVQVVTEWSDNIKLKQLLKEIVKDILITGAGNAWVELGYTPDTRDILGVRILNPKYMDYIRDNRGKVKLLEDNTIEGYVQKGEIFRYETEWRKDSIKIGGEEVWTPKHRYDDGRYRVAHFKLFGLGESFLGMTPFETIYKQAIIRLNLEHNVGEGIYRSGALVAKVGEPDQPSSSVSEEELDDAIKQLQDINIRTILAFRRNVNIESLPTPDLRGKEELIYYFADVQCAGVGVPLDRLMMPRRGRTYRGEEALKGIVFENRIKGLQEDLAEQVREYFFYRLLLARGLIKPNEYHRVPKVIFRSYQPILLRERSRTAATYARRGLLRWDPEIEKKIRDELGYPSKFVQRQLDEWVKDISKVPETSGEVEVKQE